MLKIGISTCGDLNLNLSELKKVKEAGIDYIEISYEFYDDFDFIKAKEVCDDAGIEIWSFHLPFYPFETVDPAAVNEEVIQNTFELHSKYIKKALEIGIKRFVLHLSAEPIDDTNREERLNNSINYASRLADFADELGAEILIEDLPRTCIGNCSAEILKFLSANDKLKACFDTNHLLSENITDFIRNVGNKIASVHISDYDFVNERHWLPGEGDIDWQELYSELMETGYNGVWMYEISMSESTTINRRKLEYKDFYNNALEIFKGNKPTPIGTRKENLGFWG